jgi:hypothetical protein
MRMREREDDGLLIQRAAKIVEKSDYESSED